jgi:hypothetical protein
VIGVGGVDHDPVGGRGECDGAERRSGLRAVRRDLARGDAQRRRRLAAEDELVGTRDGVDPRKARAPVGRQVEIGTENVERPGQRACERLVARAVGAEGCAREPGRAGISRERQVPVASDRLGRGEEPGGIGVDDDRVVHGERDWHRVARVGSARAAHEIGVLRPVRRETVGRARGVLAEVGRERQGDRLRARDVDPLDGEDVRGCLDARVEHVRIDIRRSDQSERGAVGRAIARAPGVAAVVASPDSGTRARDLVRPAAEFDRSIGCSVTREDDVVEHCGWADRAVARGRLGVREGREHGDGEQAQSDARPPHRREPIRVV